MGLCVPDAFLRRLLFLSFGHIHSPITFNVQSLSPRYVVEVTHLVYLHFVCILGVIPCDLCIVLCDGL